MKDNKRAPLLTQLAKQYLDEDGRRLVEEARKLEETASAPMPAVDGKVKRFRSTRRRGRYVAAFGAVAAGLLLIFLLPRMEVMSPPSDAPLAAYVDEPAAATETYTSPESEAIAALPQDAEAGGTALDAQTLEPNQRTTAIAEDTVPQEIAAAPAVEKAPAMEDAAMPSSDAAAAPQMQQAAPLAAAPREEAADAAPQPDAYDYAQEEAEETPSMSPAIIPLSFTLPTGFTVEGVRQDKGETIYKLANADLDDVILSLEDAATAALSTGGLVEVSGEDGAVAYGLAGSDVQFLTFEQDGLRYRLTCRHDIQTLLSLWQHIVSS